MQKTMRAFRLWGGLILLLGIVYGVQYVYHRWQQPWDYASVTPSLVGHWFGPFKDPDGIPKTLELEIFKPEVDWLNRKRRGGNKQSFKGVARVKSRLGQEQYRLEGVVRNSQQQALSRITFLFQDENTRLRNNFNLMNAEEGGTWESDALNLTLTFRYITESGSAFSSSNDHRYTTTVPVRLKRMSP